MTGDIDIFDRIPICFRGILPCSRDENGKRERERDAFWKTCSSFNVFRDVAKRGGSSLASFFHREGESKSRKGGGRAKCTPVLRDVTFTFYVYSLRL